MEDQNIEQTLIILKPEVIEKNLVGEVLVYWDKCNFKCKAMITKTGTREEFAEHFQDHLNALAVGNHNEFLDLMTRGPCVFAIYEGNNVIDESIKMLGNDDPDQANSETIRFRFGADVNHNVAYVSTSRESFLREKEIWFSDLDE